ncbi:MAG: hypothetical protein ACTSWY_01265 [Promethearchaeota archaeon]
MPANDADLKKKGKINGSKKESSDLGRTIIEINSNYMYGRKEHYQVIQLDKGFSKTDLMKKIRKNTKESSGIDIKKSGNTGDKFERGITAVLDNLESEFFNSCPKCGGNMHPTFILLGMKERMSVYQCKTCNFYLPRNILL